MPCASSELIIKAIKLVSLLMRKEQVTVIDVADELEICSRNAHHWLMAASIVLPIYSPNEDTRLQTEHIVYAFFDEFEEHRAKKLCNKRKRLAMRYFEKRKGMPWSSQKK